jgi:NAD(P)-dependent dehydrogenase (short-subunit alcohol dehydrogenase family)
MRSRQVDLSGYSALVTGGRLKIGFETALKLLRCGAQVTVTTRFVEDAAARFARQADGVQWSDRLRIIGADFRDVRFVECMVESLASEFGTLDILVNNAAQTLRRPPAFYWHLLSETCRRGLAARDGATWARLAEHGDVLACPPGRTEDALSVLRGDGRAIAMLSQAVLMPGDEDPATEAFPASCFDKDGQQEDRREFNSWMMKLEDVHLVEFLEVIYVNVVAPFLLCSKLRRSMRKRSDERPSFIVNVSAMEGNFHNPKKNARHPHTNMAKAAVNMMTRTAAIDYREDRIFMNSVDPGWITNERPFPREMSRSERVERLAIDEIDGAARICDPIFRALEGNEYLSGVLLKNYRVYPW